MGREMVPLQQWRLKNFKSLVDVELDLGPLNLLVGTNSSGKSSFIQSVLLVAQAAASSVPGDSFPLNGPLISMGEYSTVRSMFTKAGGISIGGAFALRPGQTERGTGQLRTRTDVAFLRRYGNESLLNPDTPYVYEWEQVLRGRAENQPGSSTVSSVRASLREAESEGAVIAEVTAKRTRTATEITLPEGRWRRRSFVRGYRGSFIEGDVKARVDGVALRGAMPLDALVRADENQLRVAEWIRWQSRSVMFRSPDTLRKQIETWESRFERVDDEDERRRLSRRIRISRIDLERALNAIELDEHLDPRTAVSQLVQIALDDLSAVSDVSTEDVNPRVHWRPLGQTARRFLIDLEEIIRRRLLKELGKGSEVPVPADSQILSSATDEVQWFLRNRVIHLGPLRQDPDVVQKSAPAAAAGHVGTKGEYTAAVLHALREKAVLCPLPEPGVSPRRMPLADALNLWVATLGVAESIETVERPRFGIEVWVTQRDIPERVDLMSVGVGVSQLLPVLVMCLLAEPGSLILLEQPELHLHPAVQQDLGDFLLAIAQSGRQLIVETHSEHVVSRLRRRIAEDTTDLLVDDVHIVFAWQEQGQSQYQRVKPNRYGALEEWPPGFFDQASYEAQAIIKAGFNKRADDSI